MSRNFELLRQAEKEQEVFRTSSSPTAPTNSRHPGLNLEAFAREEEIKLVQRLFLAPRPDAPQAVLFSGIEHGDGCSWICARASETLAAQAQGSVCLVDANLRSPSLHQYFGVENSCGLTDAVLESGPIRNFAQQLTTRSLWLVPCGSRKADLPALLTSDRLQSRIKELRAEFDHVLIDAPPVNLYADAILLGQLADGVILVLESNSTRREAARRAKETLEAAKVRLLGVVLNKRTFPIPEALYRKL